jgi:NADH-quinone oxidoreductase subunit L
MAQTDIKRVLAYSTISQLGYMFLACGVAAYSAAIFHLMTHAFFKALLFLAAGSVIHALGGEQDMRNMGGLRRHIPWTFWTMTAATFAIAGFPFLSGFFSKDEILWRAWSSPYGSWIFWAVGVGTAGLTSFYMFRLWFLAFFGESRGPEDRHPHESPRVMLAPLVILAVLAVVGGYVGVPHSLGGENHFERFLAPAVGAPVVAAPAGMEHEGAAAAAEVGAERMLTAASVGAAALGLFFAWLLYHKRRDLPEKIALAFGGMYTAVANKYYVDEGYDAVLVQPVIEGSTRLLWRGVDAGLIDGAVNHAAGDVRRLSDTLRHMQSGSVRSYAGWVAAGAALVLAYLIWVGAR